MTVPVVPVPIPIVTNDSKSYLTRKANIARTSKGKLREKRERSALYELNELRASSPLIASVLSTLIAKNEHELELLRRIL